jgi:hypothetical protein
MWYRVFCRSSESLPPSELLAVVHSFAPKAIANFKGDDLGWTTVELILGTGTPIYGERYLTGEDELREDLNTWAAWLETRDYSPNHVMLMERVIQTQQMITLRKPVDSSNESLTEGICGAICLKLASTADGVYQIEGDGWYDAAGELLLKEY